MTSVQEFALLQSRVFAFVASQDDATVRAIIAGSARLAVQDGVPAPTSVDVTRMTVPELRKHVRARGHRNYSKLKKAELVALLQADVDDPAARMAESVPPVAAHDGALDAREASPRADPIVAEPPVTTPALPSSNTGEAVAVVARLRELETEDDGAAYLDSLRVDREALLAIAAELRLTRLDRVSNKELRRRVLKQAIGARRKFAGLRDG